MRLIKLLTILAVVFFGINIYTARAEDLTLSLELATCLKEKMGSEAFDSVKAGNRTPTAEEKEKSSVCFRQYGGIAKKAAEEVKSAGNRSEKFSDKTTACLRNKLGDNYDQVLSSAKSETDGKALREKASACFDGEVKEKEGGDSAKACIVKTVGEAEATKMFNGDRPSQDSETYKKLVSAGCLKKFERQGNSRPEDANISTEKKSCIEGIIGKLDVQPSEAQKQQIGQKCFGGQGGPKGEDQGRGGGNRSLPSEVASCLSGSLGDYRSKSPDQMTDDEKNKAGECFRQHNFTPAGANPARDSGGGPALSSDAKACIERVTGKSISSGTVDETTKQRIGQECFGGVRQPGADNGGGGGQPAAPRRAEAPDKADCANRVNASLQGQQLSDTEVRARVSTECYGGQSGQAGSDNGANIQQSGEQRGKRPGETEGSSTRGARPGGCQDDACVEQYCKTNPGVCGTRPN